MDLISATQNEKALLRLEIENLKETTRSPEASSSRKGKEKARPEGPAGGEVEQMVSNIHPATAIVLKRSKLG